VSYCRWSSEDWKSDVYVYQDVNGWTTHVAGLKSAYTGELPPYVDLSADFTDAEVTAWWNRNQHVRELMNERLVPIGLAYDGESFSDPTPGACADRLEHLRAVGYHVPEGAIIALRAEHMDRDGDVTPESHDDTGAPGVTSGSRPQTGSDPDPTAH
jgi:hypothetical protein